MPGLVLITSWRHESLFRDPCGSGAVHPVRSIYIGNLSLPRYPGRNLANLGPTVSDEE